MEDAAPAHVALQGKQVLESDAVEEHGIGARILHHRCEHGRQVEAVTLDQRLQHGDGHLRLVGQQKDAPSDPLRQRRGHLPHFL